MPATMYIGDAIEVMSKLPERSVDLILSSPPFWKLRSYLPGDHELKSVEGGSEDTPGEFIDWLIDVAEACDRVLAPHGSMAFELGDTYSNGDGGGPRAKSLTLIPEMFRFSLVYGFNPLTGRKTEPWILRNVIRWVRPNPPVGALGDKFRPATSELMVFCKSAKRYFDLDSVRTPFVAGENGGGSGHTDDGTGEPGGTRRMPERMMTHSGAPPLDWWNIPLLEGEEETRYGPTVETPKPRTLNPKQMAARQAGVVRGAMAESTYHKDGGAPPLDWWEIPPGGYEGAHYAVFPPELCVKPVKAMCPEKVCRTCGEPSRRMLKSTDGQQSALAAHIKERRTAKGITSDEINGWFGFKEIAKNWERTDEWGAAIPSAKVWPTLKERLGLDDEFDEVISRYSERRLVGSNGVVEETPRVVGDFMGSGSAGKRDGGITAQWTTLGFSDCGHDDWRPGLVLDPFAGSGTTLAVATGHGRDAIGIDLDERNFDLALDRVGPFILSRGDLETPTTKEGH